MFCVIMIVEISLIGIVIRWDAAMDEYFEARRREEDRRYRWELAKQLRPMRTRR